MKYFCCCLVLTSRLLNALSAYSPKPVAGVFSGNSTPIVSNPDADHIGDSLDVFDTFEVRSVYLTGDLKATLQNRPFGPCVGPHSLLSSLDRSVRLRRTQRKLEVHAPCKERVNLRILASQEGRELRDRISASRDTFTNSASQNFRRRDLAEHAP